MRVMRPHQRLWERGRLMIDLIEHKLAAASLLLLLALLACVLVTPSFVNDGNVSLPPQRQPTATPTATRAEDSAGALSTVGENEGVDVLASETATALPAATDPPAPILSPTPDATASPQPSPPSPPAAGPQPLTIVEQGFVSDAVAGRTAWFVLIANPNADWSFEDVAVRAINLEGGSETELGQVTLQSVAAGEKTGVGGWIVGANAEDADELDVRIEPRRAVPGASAEPSRVERVAWQPLGAGGQITGLVHNPLNVDLVDLALLGIVRDSAGTPVAVQPGSMSFVPAAGESGAVISVPTITDGANAEIYVTRTSETKLVEVQPPPLIDIVAHGVVVDGSSDETLWAAIFESHHQAGTVVDSQVFLTLLDGAGAVIGVDVVNVEEIRPQPQGRTAVLVTLDDGIATPDTAIFHTRYGAVVEDGPGAISTEDVIYLDDQGIPRVEGNLRSSVNRALEDVAVVALVFDGGGAVIGAGRGAVPNLPAFGWAFAQVIISLDDDASEVAGAEMYLSASFTMRFDAVDP